MIWLTWRQHRKQALFTLVGLAILAALTIPTGLAIRDTYADLGLPDCARLARDDGTCEQAWNQFNSQYDTILLVGILFLVLPVLVGLFWGAPLVARELEHGTHRLVWTQGVSRKRWALVKFGLVAVATLAVSAIYGLGVGWWLGPLTAGGGRSRFGVLFFDMQGVVPIGYTLFAVALGIFAGTVWHKVLPAMAVTLAGFVGLRIALTVLARPHYLPAREVTSPITASAPFDESATRGSWTLGEGIRDSSGKMVADGVTVGCPPDGPSDGPPCGAQFGEGAYNWALYHPADRFWLFQGIETGIFIGLAAALLYLAVRRIRRIA